MAQQNHIPKLNFPEMQPAFQQHYNQMIDSVNSLLGFNGPIVLNNHIDMQGNLVKNSGTAVAAGDLVSQAFTNDNYSASALAPQLQAGGSSPLQSVRRVGDQLQREPYSSFLNKVMSTPPNANTSTITAGPLVGGSVEIDISPGMLRFADGSNEAYDGFTDHVSPSSNLIITSISSSGDTVTVTVIAASGLAPGDVFTVTGVTTVTGTADYNGTFVVATVISPFELTYTLPGAGTGTGTGGFVMNGSVFYYFVIEGDKTIHRTAIALSADTPNNRLETSTDTRQLIAVVTLNASGYIASSSAAGNTATTGATNAGSFF